MFNLFSRYLQFRKTMNSIQAVLKLNAFRHYITLHNIETKTLIFVHIPSLPNSYYLLVVFNSKVGT